MDWHRFDGSTLPATPWKNGGGVTHEVARHPANAGLDLFDWRVSIARIASDGPFSAFAGVDRVITLLDGGGVHLTSDVGGIDHRLDCALQPFAFPGDVSIQARLLAGESNDFNVMTRRAACRAHVEVLRSAHPLSAPQGLLFSAGGQWRVQVAGHAPELLEPQHGLWWYQALTWQLRPATPDAALLAVSIHPAAPLTP